MNDRELPPPSAFRPLHLRLMMGSLELAWKHRLLPPADLDPDHLRHLAEKATGLSHDPDRDFFESQLAVLLPAIREEARLTSFGRLVAHGTILKLMKERLWFHALLNEHPEIRRIELAPPVIVVGPMRSGTTRLQRLLACDPAFTALKLYEASCPVPSPPVLAARRAGRVDPRIGQTRWALRLLTSINPAIAHIHPTGPLEVDEELGLLEQSLSGALIEAQRRVPSFARHCEQTDQLPAYRRMLDLLKLRAWLVGEDPARPYVLKTPQHMQDLGALLTIFPDARFLFLHRDPVNVVASGASLSWNQMIIQSDHVDPHWVGQEWLHKTAHRMAVTEAVRPRIPAANQIDIGFAEMNRDWRGAMGRIHDFLGRELTPAVQQRMAAYLERAARDHGYARHRYRLEQFGLTADAVRDRLGPWVEATERDFQV